MVGLTVQFYFIFLGKIANVAIFRMLTFTGAFIGLQLHEVGAGAGEGLVEVDETEVGAGTAGTWVGS